MRAARCSLVVRLSLLILLGWTASGGIVPAWSEGVRIRAWASPAVLPADASCRSSIVVELSAPPDMMEALMDSSGRGPEVILAVSSMGGRLLGEDGKWSRKAVVHFDRRGRAECFYSYPALHEEDSLPLLERIRAGCPDLSGYTTELMLNVGTRMELGGVSLISPFPLYPFQSCGLVLRLEERWNREFDFSHWPLLSHASLRLRAVMGDGSEVAPVVRLRLPLKLHSTGNGAVVVGSDGLVPVVSLPSGARRLGVSLEGVLGESAPLQATLELSQEKGPAAAPLHGALLELAGKAAERLSPCRIPPLLFLEAEGAYISLGVAVHRLAVGLLKSSSSSSAMRWKMLLKVLAEGTRKWNLMGESERASFNCTSMGGGEGKSSWLDAFVCGMLVPVPHPPLLVLYLPARGGEGGSGSTQVLRPELSFERNGRAAEARVLARLKVRGGGWFAFLHPPWKDGGGPQAEWRLKIRTDGCEGVLRVYAYAPEVPSRDERGRRGKMMIWNVTLGEGDPPELELPMALPSSAVSSDLEGIRGVEMATALVGPPLLRFAGGGDGRGGTALVSESSAAWVYRTPPAELWFDLKPGLWEFREDGSYLAFDGRRFSMPPLVSGRIPVSLPRGSWGEEPCHSFQMVVSDTMGEVSCVRGLLCRIMKTGAGRESTPSRVETPWREIAISASFLEGESPASGVSGGSAPPRSMPRAAAGGEQERGTPSHRAPSPPPPRVQPGGDTSFSPSEPRRRPEATVASGGEGASAGGGVRSAVVPPSEDDVPDALLYGADDDEGEEEDPARSATPSSGGGTGGSRNAGRGDSAAGSERVRLEGPVFCTSIDGGGLHGRGDVFDSAGLHAVLAVVSFDNEDGRTAELEFVWYREGTRSPILRIRREIPPGKGYIYTACKSPSASFPRGRYRVQVFLDGALVGEGSFTVLAR